MTKISLLDAVAKALRLGDRDVAAALTRDVAAAITHDHVATVIGRVADRIADRSVPAPTPGTVSGLVRWHGVSDAVAHLTVDDIEPAKPAQASTPTAPSAPKEWRVRIAPVGDRLPARSDHDRRFSSEADANAFAAAYRGRFRAVVTPW